MKVCAMTDIGISRETNQDYVYTSNKNIGNLPNLFIVADGMGGHKAGEVASSMAVKTVVDEVKNHKAADRLSILQDAIHCANERVIQEAYTSDEYAGMGTTLVVATVDEESICVGNIGDSRLYLIDDDIHQITRDHSYVEEMVSLGELDKESARTHSKKNIITRAVGVDKDTVADFFEVECKKGDRILMCSDGLSNMVDDRSLFEIVTGTTDIDDTVHKLIQTANANGGKDNIAVVLAEIE